MALLIIYSLMLFSSNNRLFFLWNQTVSELMKLIYLAYQRRNDRKNGWKIRVWIELVFNFIEKLLIILLRSILYLLVLSSCLLFQINFNLFRISWFSNSKCQSIETKGSRSQKFCKISVPNNFTKFTRKYLCRSLFIIFVIKFMCSAVSFLPFHPYCHFHH